MTRRQVLSFLFLKARYSAKHYLGVALCLAGLGALVASDAYYNRDEGTVIIYINMINGRQLFILI
jgi:hypothetical protein